MNPERTIPAIWVRFTPYIAPWAEDEYGTGLRLCGRCVLELRPLPGIRDLMREPVVDDATCGVPDSNTLSQLHYELVRAAFGANVLVASTHYHLTPDELRSFLPVSVPEYLLQKNGAIHHFARTMQLRHTTANKVADAVYAAFWRAVHQYATGNAGAFTTDKDMLQSFCEHLGIPDIAVDDMRNQYQRLKRKNYF